MLVQSQPSSPENESNISIEEINGEYKIQLPTQPPSGATFSVRNFLFVTVSLILRVFFCDQSTSSARKELNILNEIGASMEYYNDVNGTKLLSIKIISMCQD